MWRSPTTRETTSPASSAGLRHHRRRHPGEDRHFWRGQRTVAPLERRRRQTRQAFRCRRRRRRRTPASEYPPASLTSLVAGANVFVLFDTSNYMYRGFVFAQDAIADFVRSLESADKVAFYSYSRDLSRAALLTADRSQVLRGVRTTVAGDDAALYNCLLLTVKTPPTSPDEKSSWSSPTARTTPAWCRRRTWPNWRSRPAPPSIW